LAEKKMAAATMMEVKTKVIADDLLLCIILITARIIRRSNGSVR
jgi:hypothetical protein